MASTLTSSNLHQKKEALCSHFMSVGNTLILYKVLSWQIMFCVGILHDHPFLTWLSWCAQSGRWFSFGKRVWFTESNIVLVIYFYLFYLLNSFLIQKKACCIKLNTWIIFLIKITVTCTPSLTSLFVHDCFPYWTASICCLLLMFPCLNSPHTTPPTYRQWFLNIRWQTVRNWRQQT